jgi:hypothetical protein
MCRGYGMSNKNDVIILKNCYCKDCGYPIISVACNHPFSEFKDSHNYDWWLYCSNKVCNNHGGEGYFQDYPLWVQTKDYEEIK